MFLFIFFFYITAKSWKIYNHFGDRVEPRHLSCLCSHNTIWRIINGFHRESNVADLPQADRPRLRNPDAIDEVAGIVEQSSETSTRRALQLGMSRMNLRSLKL